MNLSKSCKRSFVEAHGGPFWERLKGSCLQRWLEQPGCTSCHGAGLVHQARCRGPLQARQSCQGNFEFKFTGLLLAVTVTEESLCSWWRDGWGQRSLEAISGSSSENVRKFWVKEGLCSGARVRDAGQGLKDAGQGLWQLSPWWGVRGTRLNVRDSRYSCYPGGCATG